MKDEILTDFLPRAFVKPYRILAYLDLKNGWLVVDTSSRKSAEEVLSELREATGSFPATPMAPEESPRTLMTDWVVSGKLPAGSGYWPMSVSYATPLSPARSYAAAARILKLTRCANT